MAYLRVRPDEAGSDERLELSPVHHRVIGSSPEADLRLTEPGIEPRHCTIYPDFGAFWVKPESGRTLLNGRRVDFGERSRIRDGDRLTLGLTTLSFSEYDAAKAEAASSALRLQAPEAPAAPPPLPVLGSATPGGLLAGALSEQARARIEGGLLGAFQRAAGESAGSASGDVQLKAPESLDPGDRQRIDSLKREWEAKKRELTGKKRSVLAPETEEALAALGRPRSSAKDDEPKLVVEPRGRNGSAKRGASGRLRGRGSERRQKRDTPALPEGSLEDWRRKRERLDTLLNEQTRTPRRPKGGALKTLVFVGLVSFCLISAGGLSALTSGSSQGKRLEAQLAQTRRQLRRANQQRNASRRQVAQLQQQNQQLQSQRDALQAQIRRMGGTPVAPPTSVPPSPSSGSTRTAGFLSAPGLASGSIRNRETLEYILAIPQASFWTFDAAAGNLQLRLQIELRGRVVADSDAWRGHRSNALGAWLEPGRYKLVVASRGGSGSYRLSASRADLLSLGGSSSSTTIGSGETGWFWVSLPRADTYQFDTAGSTFDTGLALFDENFRQLAIDSNSGPGATSQIVQRCGAGRYLLAVWGQLGRSGLARCRASLSGGGSGSGVAATVPGGSGTSAANPVTLALGTPVRTRLASGTSLWARLVISQTAEIRLTTEGSDFDTVLRLYDRNQSLLEENDDTPSGGLTSQITRRLSPGFYLVCAQGYNTNAGNLVLLAEDMSASMRSAQMLPLNGQITGRLSQAGEAWAQISISSPGQYRFSTEGSSFDTRLKLYDAQRTMLAQNDDDPRGGLHSVIERRLDRGTYLLQITGFSSAAGSWQLSSRTLQSRTSTPLRLNVAQNGFLPTNTSGVWFEFTVTVPGEYRFDSNGSAFDTVLELYDANDNRLEYDDDGGVNRCSMITRDLTPGTYQLLLRGYSTAHGGRYVIRARGGTATVDRRIPSGRDFNEPVMIRARDARDRRTYQVEVDQDVTALEINLGGRGQADLLVYFEQPPGPGSPVVASSRTSGATEQVTLSRGGRPELETGTYYVEVVRSVPSDLSALLSVVFRSTPPPVLSSVSPARIVLTDEPGQVQVLGSNLVQAYEYKLNNRRVSARVSNTGNAVTLNIPVQFPPGDYTISVETPEGMRATAGETLRVEREQFEEYEFHNLVFRTVPAGEMTLGLSDEGPGGQPNKDDPVGDLVQEPRRDYRMLPNRLMSKFEVTQDAWDSVMGRDDPSIHEGPRIPVNNVDLERAQAFCERLNQLAQADPRWRRFEFRLPNEDEWEYVCRAGTRTPIAVSSSATNRRPFANRMARMAWFQSHRPPNQTQGPFEVGGLQENPWGFHDMHGNVGEWCLPSRSLPRPPAGHAPFRGGSWTSEYRGCRSSQRDLLDASFTSASTGFRVIAVPR